MADDHNADDDGALERLRASGFAESTVAAFRAAGLYSADALWALGETEWAHLYASGVPLSERARLRGWLLNARPVQFQIKGRNLVVQVRAWTLGILASAPGLAIGLINEFGPLHSERALSGVESTVFVLVPACLYLLGAAVFVDANRSIFSTDVLEQRSDGVSLRDAQRTNLTNIAVVAALLVTVIVAMVQAEPPLPDTDRLLPQWYVVFLLASMTPCFLAVMVASVLLIYLEPLDEEASVGYIGYFLAYMGEPIMSTLFGIANFVPALTLWIFGVYGLAPGVAASFATILLVRKLLSTVNYLMIWRNPTLDEAVQVRRERERRQLVKDSRRTIMRKDPPSSPGRERSAGAGSAQRTATDAVTS